MRATGRDRVLNQIFTRQLSRCLPRPPNSPLSLIRYFNTFNDREMALHQDISVRQYNVLKIGTVSSIRPRKEMLFN